MDKHKKHNAEEKTKRKNGEDIEHAAGIEADSAPEKKDATANNIKNQVNVNDTGRQETADMDMPSEQAVDTAAGNDQEIRKLKSEIESLKDIMQRRQADFENYKKRQLKLYQEQKKFAIKDLALDIVMINDDLLRAVEAASGITKDQSLEESHKAFVNGVMMISQRIEEALKRYGIVEIDSLNQPFDPNCNEAVEIETSRDVEHDTVTKVYQKGFRIDDIVLRSARVRVAKPAKAEVRENDSGCKGAGSEDGGTGGTAENYGDGG